MRKICEEVSVWNEIEGTCVNILDVKDREFWSKQIRDIIRDKYIAEYMAELLKCDVLSKENVELLRTEMNNVIQSNAADIDAKIIADEVEDAVDAGNIKNDENKIWIGFDEVSGDLVLTYVKDYTEEKRRLNVAKRVLNMINSFKCD